MLDIEKLRLTKSETPYIQMEGDSSYQVHQSITDAQLAKAAYGLADWMKSTFARRKAMTSMSADILLKALEQANIERPTGTPASPDSAEQAR